MSTALEKSISLIDDLIRKLQDGSFDGTDSTATPTPKQPPPATAAAPIPTPTAKASKPKKEKPAKPAKQPTAPPAVEGPALFARAHIAAARVLTAEPHPASEKLYITRLDVGNGQTRQVVAGLRKYVGVEELQGSLVTVVLNLKPAKLAGEVSEGMILASSCQNSEMVKPIRPAEGSEAGDAVFLEGQEGAPDSFGYAKQLKSDHWRKIAAGLAVKDGVACFEGTEMKTNAGGVLAVGFPDDSTIS